MREERRDAGEVAEGEWTLSYYSTNMYYSMTYTKSQHTRLHQHELMHNIVSKTPNGHIASSKESAKTHICAALKSIKVYPTTKIVMKKVFGRCEGGP